MKTLVEEWKARAKAKSIEAIEAFTDPERSDRLATEAAAIRQCAKELEQIGEDK